VAPGSETWKPQQQLGPQLLSYALNWADSHIGLGQDTVREATRVEYRRLLSTFALSYFPAETRVGELTYTALKGFMVWLRSRPGPRGRLSERSIRNAVTPLRLCLRCAHEEGLIGADVVEALALPRRRTQRVPEGRFLTRAQLTRLLAEIPEQWRPFFGLLASTGLRVSEAIALRWRDLELDHSPHLSVRRSIVNGVVGPPKSRHGFRRIPLSQPLAQQLAELRTDAGEEDLVFRGPRGAPLNPNNARYRVLAPALKRARLPQAGFHALRHTCASLLIERGLSPLRLQRWMGHHSAAYTLDVYGHLIDAELAPALDLEDELTGEFVAGREL
jgi:integrase